MIRQLPMTIHCIRLTLDPNPTVRQYLGTWITNMDPWDDPRCDNQPPTDRDLMDPATGEPTGATAMTATWRFAWHHERSVLVEGILGQAKARCEWGTVGWHECTHDADDPGPCPDFEFGLPGGFNPRAGTGVWGDLPPGVPDPRTR